MSPSDFDLERIAQSLVEHRHKVLQFIRTRLPSSCRMFDEDVLSEALCNTFRWLKRRHEDGSLPPLDATAALNCLFVAARWAAGHAVRQSRTRRRALECSAAEQYLRDVPTSDGPKHLRIMAALEQCSVVNRETLIQFFIDEASVGDLATRWGVSFSAAQGRVRRAKAELARNYSSVEIEATA